MYDINIELLLVVTVNTPLNTQNTLDDKWRKSLVATVDCTLDGTISSIKADGINCRGSGLSEKSVNATLSRIHSYCEMERQRLLVEGQEAIKIDLEKAYLAKVRSLIGFEYTEVEGRFYRRGVEIRPNVSGSYVISTKAGARNMSRIALSAFIQDQNLSSKEN